MCFSSYKNCKLKVKLWWVGACERKKRAFFVPLTEGNFFNISVLSQCLVYWTHSQNIHTSTYKKILLHALSLVVFKIIKSLQCILKFMTSSFGWAGVEKQKLLNITRTEEGWYWNLSINRVLYKENF